MIEQAMMHMQGEMTRDGEREGMRRRQGADVLLPAGGGRFKRKAASITFPACLPGAASAIAS